MFQSFFQYPLIDFPHFFPAVDPHLSALLVDHEQRHGADPANEARPGTGWIGLRKNLQETMVFTIKYRGFLWFPVNFPIIFYEERDGSS